MSDSLSADTTAEPSSDDYGASDPTPPDLDSSGGIPENVMESFDVTVEQTLVEVKGTGEELLQWQASCDGEQVVSDSIMDATMGVLVQANGGELP